MRAERLRASTRARARRYTFGLCSGRGLRRLDRRKHFLVHGLLDQIRHHKTEFFSSSVVVVGLIISCSDNHKDRQGFRLFCFCCSLQMVYADGCAEVVLIRKL